jgi:hypothetical protein
VIVKQADLGHLGRQRGVAFRISNPFIDSDRDRQLPPSDSRRSRQVRRHRSYLVLNSQDAEVLLPPAVTDFISISYSSPDARKPRDHEARRVRAAGGPEIGAGVVTNHQPCEVVASLLGSGVGAPSTNPACTQSAACSSAL